MKKLLLVVMTWMVLVGASRAQDAPAENTGPGMVTVAVKNARDVVFRFTRHVQRNLIAKGMTPEQVAKILGPSPGGFGNDRWYVSSYPSLGIKVFFGTEVNAAGDIHDAVTSVNINALR